MLGPLITYLLWFVITAMTLCIVIGGGADKRVRSRSRRIPAGKEQVD